MIHYDFLSFRLFTFSVLTDKDPPTFGDLSFGKLRLKQGIMGVLYPGTTCGNNMAE